MSIQTHYATNPSSRVFPEKTFALDSKLAMDKTCPSELSSAVEDDHACEKKQYTNLSMTVNH